MPKIVSVIRSFPFTSYKFKTQYGFKDYSSIECKQKLELVIILSIRMGIKCTKCYMLFFFKSHWCSKRTILTYFLNIPKSYISINMGVYYFVCKLCANELELFIEFRK